jgi:UDP-N-acetyl-D-galactosamine dehydrogenase
VVAVAHRSLVNTPLSGYVDKLVADGCFIDVKAQFGHVALKAAGVKVWRL